jgi:biopolymer transport protein TolR
MGVSVGGSKGFVSEINVTPFVDVMLVLLIIFMVTAPMMTEGLDIQLPKTQAVSALPTDANHVVLSIKNDGTVYLGDVRTTIDTLAIQIMTVVTNQNKRLFLQADANVPYGTVVDVMGRIKAAGIADIGLVAERLDETPPVTQPAPPTQKPQTRGR